MSGLLLVSNSHCLLEESIDLVEHRGLLLQNLLDFRGAEDVLEIHPRLLQSKQVFCDRVHRNQFFSKLFCLLVNNSFVLIASDHVDVRKIFVEECIQIINLIENKYAISVFVGLDNE